MIGENVTDAQLKEMLTIADLDKDGKINYEGEFETLSNRRRGNFHYSILFVVSEFAKLLA